MSQPKHVNAVIVGLGWTGAILAKELTDAGLSVVALERGGNRTTKDDAKYPNIADELAYSIRGKLYQDLATETVTIRHNDAQIAVPYRQIGSFYLGNGVGGAGFHWNGMHWRVLPEELKIKSHYQERYGAGFIPKNMTIQDFGISYEELEPYFTKFEKVCGTSGKAGNLNGIKISGGNVLEGVRSEEYPNPPLANVYGADLFYKGALEAGFNPFPSPAANASNPYTNPYGVTLGPCNFCGFCENYGCYMYSKASPQSTILPALTPSPLFEMRTHATVIKVNTDASGKTATGVTYINAQGQQIEQTADIVILAAFQIHNVRLLLLSKIGQPYDPRTGTGTVGKNLAYQFNTAVNVTMPKGTLLNPFIGAGAGGAAIDNLNGDKFDHGPLGFIGGAVVKHNRTGGRPIGQASLPKGAPRWGKGWQAALQDNYQRQLSIGCSGSVMSYKDAYLDLDPTYQDSLGQPLIRMTFDWHDNEGLMGQYVTKEASKIAKGMGAESYELAARAVGAHYDTRTYQSTHLTGGAIMGDNPSTSVVNKYCQSWDVPNLFVLGACAFPQNMGYNPTGLVGALAYHAADAIIGQYKNNPGPLVQA